MAGGPRIIGRGRRFGTRAAAEPFISGSSSTYIEDMYEAWQRDPNSVHKVRGLSLFCPVCQASLFCPVYQASLFVCSLLPLLAGYSPENGVCCVVLLQ